MSYLTERLLNAQYHNHEEDCCCGEECCCHDHEEKEIEQQLSEEEIEKIIEEKYSEKDEKTKEFIRKGLRKFGDRFDYSKTQYVRAKDKVIITCLKEGHGDFKIQPGNFLMRGRCQKCGKEKSFEQSRSDTQTFIEKAKKVHGDKYDYSKVNYINNHTRVTIICPIHGEFEQLPHNHLSGAICLLCSRELNKDVRRLTTEEFVRSAIEVHGDKYDYSSVNYISSTTPVTIICPIHGKFEQLPPVHVFQGCGCPECGREILANKFRFTTEEFIKRARLIHGDKYDYSKVNYINNHTPVIIICPIHGEFEQLPYNHLNQKSGCPKCANNVQLTTEEFISRAIEVHGDGTYSYEQVDYINTNTPIKIYDPMFNEFFYQTPRNHLMGYGNPIRSISFGERQVYNWLKKESIVFNREYWLENTWGRHGNRIRVDFLLPSYNFNKIIIEYNGIQHYKMTNKFHSDLEDFYAQLSRDKELREYCKINSINLIEIPYTINTHQSISTFLTKTLIENIDPYTLVDYDSLYKIDDSST